MNTYKATTLDTQCAVALGFVAILIVIIGLAYGAW